MMKLRMRKGMAMLVALCMLIMMIPVSVFATSTFAPTDIIGHWAQPEIQSWIDGGLVVGYPDGTFKPGQNVTRAEFMTLVNGAFGYTEVATINYTDVQSGSWYYSAVAKAEAAGYIDGYGDGTMKPGDPITREEAAKIISVVNALTTDVTAISNYSDKTFISGWAEGYVGAVTTAGIMQGYPDDSFMPKGNITRAEAVFALDKAMDYATPLAVKSISAINATQLKVVFTQAVDKTDAETAANYKIGIYTVTAALQADAKTVILTSTDPITGTNLYVVNPIKSATDATVKTPIFTYVETYTDTVAPIVTNVTYSTFDKATVTFSEPLSAIGNVTITQDGVAVPSITNDFVIGKAVVTFDLTNELVAVDKPITVVIVGAKDTGNNLITPNPTTLILTKSKTDVTKPTVSAINVLSDTRVSVTFSEKLNVAPTVSVGGNTVSFVAAGSTTDNITWVGTFAHTTGVLPVAITVFTDMSGNIGTAVTVLKQVTADTAKPTLISSEVKTFNSKLYLVLHYSEDVDAVLGGEIVTGTRVEDHVSIAFSTQTAVTPIAVADDTKAVMLDLSSDTTFPVGAYTVTVPASFVQDKASTVNFNDATSITFTKGTLTVNDTTAPTVNALPTISLDNKYVTVTFSEAMDYATALNVANYKVSGQTIFTNAIFDTANNIVKLTVAPGTITYSGDRLMQVSGAKDLAGNLNTAYSNIVTFKENVAPYVSSAKLTTDKTIEVTFSENVAATTATDFEVYVGGVKVDGAKVATSVSGTATNIATITLTDAITDLTKAIQVKLVNPVTADVNGNPATTGQFVTVQ